MGGGGDGVVPVGGGGVVEAAPGSSRNLRSLTYGELKAMSADPAADDAAARVIDCASTCARGVRPGLVTPPVSRPTARTLRPVGGANRSGGFAGAAGAAEAGDEDYGILTLLVQLRYQPVNSFRIPASCFFPEPEIDSTCIKLVRRPDALLSLQEAAIFSKVVKRSFSQRRKMMMKLLKQDWPANTLEEAFQQLSLSVQVRAEAVTLGQFVNLSRVLAATV